VERISRKKENAGKIKGANQMKILQLITIVIFVLLLNVAGDATLKDDFDNPPDSARPGVYWYFMDGNLNEKEMVKDLESIKEVGLGNLVFLEVNIGVPRGPVDFMSDQWQNMFVNAVRHAERLGIDITLGAGPGWTGSGGPWVKAEQSMQHLVFSTVETKGPGKFDGILTVGGQRSTRWHRMRSDFYEDVVVYAFPKCAPIIGDINEKALYERDPYTSKKGVKPYLPAPAKYPSQNKSNVIDPGKMIDLTDRLQTDGRLKWNVLAGEWTIMRMGRRSTGASTRPAPEPGIGFDHDKLDKAALEDHFQNYYGKLLKKVGPRAKKHGWTTVHLDSWEMGAQNWTPKFRAEFTKRRGYDPQPYLVTFSGRAVKSVEVSERFLWDVRLTAQELVLENYAGHLKTLGRKYGFELSIEPYDMNPTADLDLGAVADVPMCEFWGAGFGFDSSFSCIESTSIAHTMGRSIVSAEAFTGQDQWQQYPWSMKNQGDWAFCMGINRFVYHTFAHKPLGDEHRPGMTMGPYGVHWDRGQTWWPMVKNYHKYVTRCSHLLRQGVTVSDILYLTPEGAPHVFRAPASALQGKGPLVDKKGYGFDGCSPNILMDRAEVKDGRIVFPGGTSYRLMVLPHFETMTPELLEKITQLVEAGAVVFGAPPVASPSLSGYPQCDAKVQELSGKMWGKTTTPVRQVGKGRIIRDPGAQLSKENERKNKPLLPRAGSWIWLNEGNPERSAAPGDVHFRYTWEVPNIRSLETARIEATADNSFTLKVNGRQVLAGDNFHNIYSADIASTLRSGRNTITVVANNASDAPNPAGFVAAMRMRYADGSMRMIATDREWDASRDGADWSAAKPLGSGNMAPWHLKQSAANTAAELYPDYATTAATLVEMGVPEDFQSDGPIRFTHRQTDDRDIYFVANTLNANVETTCTFRVKKAVPQLWDPVTAEIRPLPRFTHEEKTTSIPMTFEPHQSFFVVFPRDGKPTRMANAEMVNFPRSVSVTTLEGAWEVSFDPNWGGPEKVTFNTLQDWTAREERGIKYYSGIATYRKSFYYSHKSGKRVYLDLGTIHDMARVRLNEKDLGVVWCAPWRVDITDVVKAKDNVLEINIANRWPNRMLGDQQAPDKDVRTVKWDSGILGGKEYKAGRYTFATTGGPNKLLPSGLLGPVRILVNTN
jgi:glycosyl hydrolase family 106( putative alpha-L-rhamnosidase)/glycosyl hydrolase family 2